MQIQMREPNGHQKFSVVCIIQSVSHHLNYLFTVLVHLMARDPTLPHNVLLHLAVSFVYLSVCVCIYYNYSRNGTDINPPIPCTRDTLNNQHWHTTVALCISSICLAASLYQARCSIVIRHVTALFQHYRSNSYIAACMHVHCESVRLVMCHTQLTVSCCQACMLSVYTLEHSIFSDQKGKAQSLILCMMYMTIY